jgi:hypothetical protein
MSVKAFVQIRQACEKIQAQGIKICRGPWYTFSADRLVQECCAMGAVLLVAEVPYPEDLVKPGFLKEACRILEVDAFWMQRFWMGWDRGHQVKFYSEKNGKTYESDDEVSAFGISLAREFVG